MALDKRVLVSFILNNIYAVSQISYADYCYAECRYAEGYYSKCRGVLYLVVHPYSKVNLLTRAAAVSSKITPKKFRRIKSYFKLVFPISNF
jgi:hypothetical protein